MAPYLQYMGVVQGGIGQLGISSACYSQACHIITINSNTNNHLLKAMYAVQTCTHTSDNTLVLFTNQRTLLHVLAAWVQLAGVPLTTRAGSLTELQLKGGALMYALQAVDSETVSVYQQYATL